MAATGPNLIEEFAKYFNSGDLDGLVSLYEGGAAFIPEPGTVLTDAAGLRAALQAFLDTKGTASIVSTTETVNGDLALTHSHWRIDIPGGGVLEHTSAEVTRRQADGTWRYVIDNPFGGAVLG
ncbi:YybH family protein [Actinomycetospora cinnamomea]|uniref:Ketosteroid isomerase-like protein n=1 Tax=Actinomycetospora cinnamomea TaxID=663609 RepID=A0A2U1F8W0_9PSEU|nr:nuclear transport factor 2 family protein [Actinomycetospora cinnamomea]PVZ08622.1 ketosteroid isomerase-like protein [Actinomycetospora cinnamomea]